MIVVFTIDHALALIRVIAGLLLLGHGAQKLFSAFGGPGVRGFAGWLKSMSIPAPIPFAWLVGLCEFVGGLLFAVGLFTPIAALAISGVMLGAIWLVHWSKGLWVSSGGFEYPLTLLTIAAAIGFAGPGLYALDTAYALTIPASTATIYLVGLVLEVAALIAIQFARSRGTVSQPSTA